MSEKNAAVATDDLKPMLMTTKQLCNYIGLGRTKATEFGIQAGARVKIGRAVRWSVPVLNQKIEELRDQAAVTQ